MNPNTPIEHKLGIFDSGIGGFSVLEKVRGNTSADVLYFGDCARAPYGNRSTDEIVLFIEEIISNLQLQGVTHFISACNSMSVMTTDKMLEECKVENNKYIDMLRAFKNHADFSDDSHVLIIGTNATIKSGAYQSVLNEKNVKVCEYIFKDLAGLIEKGVKEDELYEIAVMGVMYAKENGVTHILYGCTHYPLIDDIFKRCAVDIGWEGMFVNPADYVGEAVSKWNLDGKNKTYFEASEVTEPFRTLANKYINDVI